MSKYTPSAINVELIKNIFFLFSLLTKKIFIITTVVLIGSIYGYYKINNRNAFEEMYNSYYNLLPLRTVDNMPQIKPIPRDEKHLDSVDLNYKNNTEDVIINIFQLLLSFFI